MGDTTEGRDPTGGAANVQPGGRSSQGPNPDPGGAEEPGGLVPPYDGRTDDAVTRSKAERAESVKRQLADTKSARDDSTATPADEQAVSADQVTDKVPDSPKGVGKSTTRSGEDIAGKDSKESGRHDAGTKGESGRPVGKSDARDSTAVDPKGSQPGAPDVGSGDQGG